MNKIDIIKRVVMMSLFLLLCQWEQGRGAVPSRTIDLDTLISICSEKNFDILSVRERITARIQKIRKARAAMLPSVNFTAVYTRIGVVPKFEIPGFEDIEFVNPDTFSFSLGIKYNLFDWGISRERVQIEKLGLNSERLNEILMKKGFGLQLSVLYANILQIEESIVVIRENMIIVHGILKILQQQYDRGYCPEHQLLQARTDLENLKARELELKTARNGMMTTLKNVAGIDPASVIVLSPLKKIDASTQYDIEELVARALQQRPEFRIIQLQLGILEKTRAIVARSRYPLFSAGLNAELSNNIMPDVARLKANWNIGLNVVYNLFDGHAGNSEKRALEHQIIEVQLKKDKLQCVITANITNILEQMKILDEKTRVEHGRLELAGRSLKLTRESFESAQASLLDVLNARSNYNLAQNGVIGLKYQKYIQLFNLEYECGGLSRHNQTESSVIGVEEK